MNIFYTCGSLFFYDTWYFSVCFVNSYQYPWLTFSFSVSVYHSIHELYDNLKYLLKCVTDGKGLVNSGLPFLGQVVLYRVFGFIYFTDLYQMLDMIETLYIYCTTIVSAITHLQRMPLPSDLLWEHRNEFVARELACIVFISQTEYSAGVFQALWLVVLAVFESVN